MCDNITVNVLWWLSVLFAITYNYQENQKYSILPCIAGFIILSKFESVKINWLSVKFDWLK